MNKLEVNDHSDPITALKAMIVTTGGEDDYFKGLCNGLRFAVVILTDNKLKYEE